MTTAEGKKTNQNGDYWCNIILATNKIKLVIGHLIDPENRIFRIRSCSSEILEHNKILSEKGQSLNNWVPMTSRIGWWYCDVFEEEINEFFNWNIR
jgi:hypothetical protein